MPMLRASFLATLGACWTSSTVQPPRPTTTDAPPRVELRATLRIDDEGAWLESGDDRRLVLEGRPADIWRSFADRAVIATGHCYLPHGKATPPTHFQIERLRLVDPVSDVPLTELGPETVLRGTLALHAFPAGSKLGGASEIVFRDGEGTQFWIHAADAPTPGPGPVAVTAREVQAAPAYAALPGGPRLWIVEFHAADYQPDPARAPTLVRCPGR
jgi:hypothetical protein